MTDNTTNTHRNLLAGRADRTVDLLVIGGGIVGAGVARDAAMRGLDVVLVEQYDFAFGTSSRSSRLLHGGMRYLAQGHLKLVREASCEKRILQRIAPHLAQPLAFVFPCFQGNGWPKWKLHIGVKLYDWLCGGKNLGRSSALSRQQTLDMLPGIRSEKLRGAVRYYDGLTNDARLVIDTLRSAECSGATLLNYVRLEDAQPNGNLWECRLHDRVASRPVELRARTIVNATGPWSDQLSQSNTHLRLTKGVHLVIDRAKLPASDAVVMTLGSRILFSIPWGDRVILGTTDTDYDGPLETPLCNADDIQYVLDVVNNAFPSAQLTCQDIISSWAGLRPLVFDGRNKPSDTSRQHQIAMPQPGWFDVTGGKLTTYRLIAEQTVDRVVRVVGRDCPPCATSQYQLLVASDATAVSDVLPPPVTEEVVRHICLNEWCMHVDDLMIRRTSWRYYYVEQKEIAERVGQWMAESLGWDEQTMRSEINQYLKQIHSETSGLESIDDAEKLKQPSDAARLRGQESK